MTLLVQTSPDIPAQILLPLPSLVPRALWDTGTARTQPPPWQQRWHGCQDVSPELKLQEEGPGSAGMRSPSCPGRGCWGQRCRNPRSDPGCSHPSSAAAIWDRQSTPGWGCPGMGAGQGEGSQEGVRIPEQGAAPGRAAGRWSRGLRALPTLGWASSHLLGSHGCAR